MISLGEKNAEFFETVFIVGAGRSGTTWLQDMLGRHPQIATGQESHLFPGYIFPLFRAWKAEGENKKSDQRHTGLRNYLTEDEFVSLVSLFARKSLGAILKLKPDADILLEKTPRHSEFLNLIALCFPDAKIIHLIRDGRAVVSSLIDASRGWGNNWAPDSIVNAAAKWSRSVVAGCEGRDLFLNYIEIRYEDLLRDTEKELKKVFDYIGVKCDKADVTTIVNNTEFIKLKEESKCRGILRGGENAFDLNSETKEPDGFFNKGTVDSWKSELSNYDLANINNVCGKQMVDLGYYDMNEFERLSILHKRIFSIARRYFLKFRFYLSKI